MVRPEVTVYKFEYTIPPSDSVHSHGVGAVDKTTAINHFRRSNPKAVIISVSEYQAGG